MTYRACILMGAPGSGKGTQAARLSKQWGVPHISTGDMLRVEVAKASDLGNQLKAAINAGKLISDEVMTAVVKERFRQPDVLGGFILDGYPRTIPQGEALFEILQDLGLKVPKVVLLELDSQSLVKRVVGRLICRDCGAIFHKELNPPPGGKCGVCESPELAARDDDTEETALRRLKVFEDETSPLVAFFTSRVELLRFGADQPLEALTGEIHAAFS